MEASAIDEAMMARCIELARTAARDGEYPFGAVVACEGKIVAEAVNRTLRDQDVTRHAEVIALSMAQKSVGRKQLRRHTLYSIVEPCAMCSYCIREAWIGRVVFALRSPIMGGLSNWNILRNGVVSDRMPEVFGGVPEVIAGVLDQEACAAWREWSPFAWEMIELRRLLVASSEQPQTLPAPRWPLAHYLFNIFRHRRRGCSGGG
ncbi:MAG TPA: nucleoside deaminase [Xanthobacteraceae bacterium]|jgi:tRNA(adenine34) deaminase|nr:nucleoside deaminase [Xanthobacteraceae bacterium]